MCRRALRIATETRPAHSLQQKLGGIFLAYYPDKNERKRNAQSCSDTDANSEAVHNYSQCRPDARPDANAHTDAYS